MFTAEERPVQFVSRQRRSSERAWIANEDNVRDASEGARAHVPDHLVHAAEQAAKALAAASPAVISTEPVGQASNSSLEDCLPPSMYARASAIGEHFTVGDLIGRGLDSIVFKAAAVPSAQDGSDGAHVNGNNGEPPKASEHFFAVKVLQKKRLVDKGARKMLKLRNEILLWKKFNHPSVVGLKKVLLRPQLRAPHSSPRSSHRLAHEASICTPAIAHRS
jgi:hypothetical protein